jgi:cytoskeletal protein RodZ
MDEIGHILREARENKGLTLEQVQEETRINSRFLNALEHGDYASLPTPVHVRGFLRNYARFLGLDPQPLLDRYQVIQGNGYLPVSTPNGEISADNPLPARQDQVFFDPVNVEVEGGGRSFGSSEGLLQLVIIIALIIALALVANRFLPLLLGDSDNANAVEEITAAVRDVIASANGGAEATATAEAQTPGDGVIIEGAVAADEEGGVIANTSRNNPGLEPTVTPTRQ